MSRVAALADPHGVLKPPELAIRDLVAEVDAVALAIERKWGIGELPTRVSAEWRTRFAQQAWKLDAAIESGLEVEVRTHAAAMIRAWAKLDQLATEAGQVPGPKATATVHLGGRAWTFDELEELVKVAPYVGQVLEGFPGAKVAGVTPKPPLDFERGDEIPF